MKLASLRNWFTGHAGLSRRKQPPRHSFVPRLEYLEDRRTPSTLSVGPGKTYPTITAAVAAANPGDTIRVYPATYNESVDVPKTLEIEAVHRNGGAVIVDPGALGPAFTVHADNVEISGFVIQNASNPTNGPGISLSASNSGYEIEDNTFQDNVFGLYLNSNGVNRTEIEHNRFLHNNTPGAASGNGIYSDQGVSNAEIEGNFFTGQTNAAMIFVGDTTVTQTHLRIEENFLKQDAPIILVNTSFSRISENVSIGSLGSGIFFGGGVHDTTVSENFLKDGAFTGINLRFDPVDYNVTTPDMNNRITDNFISGFGDNGIRLREGASGNLVAENIVVRNGTNNDPTTGDGISLENAGNNVVRYNFVAHNRRNGIFVDAASAGNTIRKNWLRGNGDGVTSFDAHDDSTGTGTAGTANTWDDNHGDTQNRPGLLDT